MAISIQSFTIAAYARPATPAFGGLSWLWLYDPTTMTFQQPTAGSSYSAIIPNSSKKIYSVDFVQESADWKATQSMAKGSSASTYSYEIDFTLPTNYQSLTQYLISLDLASAISGLGVIVLDRNGKAFVFGELCAPVTNTTPTPPAVPTLSDVWSIRQDGAVVQSGKGRGDQNGVMVKLKCDYNRPPIEFVGSGNPLADLLALQ